MARLSQGEVAAEVGCKQSALSMFEQGQPTKLNDEVVSRLIRKFNIDTSAPSAAPVGAEPQSGFCPNPACPSNHAYQVEGRVLRLPDMVAADPVGGRFCAMCGEILERRCPNCGAPVHRGAICSHCGEPYVAG